jgi:hypothetical protein
MAGWQSPQHDPGQQHGYDQTQYTPTPGQYGQPQTPAPQQYAQPQYGQPAQPYEQYQPAPAAARPQKTGLTGAEQFWYVLQCIYFGAGYFAKIPAKKAMADFGLTQLTGGEEFWYVVMCVFFGAGYFAKIPTAKALSELPQFRPATGYYQA